MARASLLVPPSVPRSVNPRLRSHENAWVSPVAVSLHPTTTPSSQRTRNRSTTIPKRQLLREAKISSKKISSSFSSSSTRRIRAHPHQPRGGASRAIVLARRDCLQTSSLTLSLSLLLKNRPFCCVFRAFSFRLLLLLLLLMILRDNRARC